MFWDIPPSEINEAVLTDLITNQVREGRRIEYKRELPGGGESAHKEFLADVTSFANAAGGDLLYGVVEEGGCPTAIPGLPETDFDREIGRLQNILLHGVDPRVQGLRFQEIRMDGKPSVLLIRIPRSWSGPHAVTLGGSFRFWLRHANGKFPLDVDELRAAFLRSDSIAERIRRFRADRIGTIVAGETPVPLDQGPLTVLHMIPFSALEPIGTADLQAVWHHSEDLAPIWGHGLSNWYNADGIVVSPMLGPTCSYLQVFRQGILEYVDAFLLSPVPPIGRTIEGIAFERGIVCAAQRGFRLLSRMGLAPPVSVLLSLLGVRGFRMAVSDFRDSLIAMPREIDRDTLLAPDVLIEDALPRVPQLLRPAFDVIWNATGYPRSLNYDTDGNWKG